jgi:hypothetical protein
MKEKFSETAKFLTEGIRNTWQRNAKEVELG